MLRLSCHRNDHNIEGLRGVHQNKVTDFMLVHELGTKNIVIKIVYRFSASVQPNGVEPIEIGYPKNL